MTEIKIGTKIVLRPAIRRTAPFSAPSRSAFVAPDPRPIQLRSFLPGPAVIKDGFPVVPQIWARAEMLASTSGEFLNYDRPNPRDVMVECHSRFVAGNDLWDDIAGVWRPYDTTGVDYYWVADPAKKPTAQEYSYRVGKEVLNLDALLFQDTDELVSRFNQDLDDASELTMVLVASFDNPTNYTALTNGPRSIRVSELFELHDGGRHNTAKTLQHPTQIAPCILIYSVRPPSATLWVVAPDRKMYTTTLTGTDEAVPMRFTLGPAPMRVVEVAFFDYAVRQVEPIEEQLNLFQLAALYSSMYGAM